METPQKQYVKYTQTLAHEKELLNEVEQDQNQQQIRNLIELKQSGMISQKELDNLDFLQNQQLEKERVNKQMYLRKEILEKGHDTQLFMEHLSQIKQDGQNIDCWQQNELEQVVNNFIDQQQSQLFNQNKEYVKDQINQNMDDYEEQELTYSEIQSIYTQQKLVPDDANNRNDTLENEEDNNKEDSVIQNNSVLHNNNVPILKKKDSKRSFFKDCFTEKRISIMENEYNEVLECKKLKDIQNLNQIDVEVTDPQLRQGGIFNFGRTYTVYKLVSTFRNCNGETVQQSEVFRRFSEFKWLRQMLKNLYPGRYIPTLFKKKTNKTTCLKKEKRKLYLQNFISDVVNNSDFLECPYLLAFLQKSSDSEFQKIVKRGKGLKEIKELKNIVNSSGSMQASISTDNNRFINCFNTYTIYAEPIYNKLKRLSKQLMIDLDNISSTYFQIGDCYKQLFEITNDFGISQEEQKFNKLNETYVRLNNLAVNQGNYCVNKIKVLQDTIYNQFKYSCREFDSYKELLKVRNDQGNLYANLKIKLNKKKEKIFNESFANFKDRKRESDTDETLQQKEKAFLGMLPQETIQVEGLKKQFGYYNNYCYEDLFRQLEMKQKVYQNTYCIMNQQVIELDQEMETCWDELVAFLNQKTDIDSIQQRELIKNLNQRTRQRNSVFQQQNQEDDEDY